MYSHMFSHTHMVSILRPVIFQVFHLATNMIVIYREPSTGKRRFVVGNIHVLFNPNRGDIKLGQVLLN